MRVLDGRRAGCNPVRAQTADGNDAMRLRVMMQRKRCRRRDRMLPRDQLTIICLHMVFFHNEILFVEFDRGKQGFS